MKVEGIEDLNPNGYGGMVSRAVTLERENINFDNGIKTIATTENPAQVVDWERWQVVREILPMRYMEAPSNDKVPFLDSHSRSKLENVKGSAKNFRIDGKNLMADVFISSSETDLRQKIKEGHVDSVSIGYKTSKDYTVEIPKEKEVMIDGIAYRNDFKDEMPLVVRTWWKVHELSGVAIGADELAKFKSAHDMENARIIDKTNDLQKQIEEIKNKLEVEKVIEENKGQYKNKLNQLKIKQLNYGNQG